MQWLESRTGDANVNQAHEDLGLLQRSKRCSSQGDAILCGCHPPIKLSRPVTRNLQRVLGCRMLNRLISENDGVGG